jgi:hypothetical protein
MIVEAYCVVNQSGVPDPTTIRHTAKESKAAKKNWKYCLKRGHWCQRYMCKPQNDAYHKGRDSPHQSGRPDMLQEWKPPI